MEEYGGSVLTWRREKGEFTEAQEYRIKALAQTRMQQEVDDIEAQIKRLTDKIKQLEKKVNGE